MRHLLTCMRWITAIAVAAALLLLAWQCIDIYMDGNAPENRTAQGVYLSSVFQWEDVAARLRNIAFPLALCGAICAGTFILHAAFAKEWRAPAGIRCGSIRQKEYCSQLPSGGCLVRLRAIILVIAIVFIVLGVMNGGLRDVLVKAINICTECIGLG